MIDTRRVWQDAYYDTLAQLEIRSHRITQREAHAVASIAANQRAADAVRDHLAGKEQAA